MNRRTFMKLIPALSVFPSIAEAVVGNQLSPYSMGWVEFNNKLLVEAFKYEPISRFIYKGIGYTKDNVPDHIVKEILSRAGLDKVGAN